MKILFVCTGNSCRSPMAEALTKKIFSEKGINCEVSSRGISVLMALPASDNAIETMESYGLDISEHLTKQMTNEDMESADLILTMTRRHKVYLNLQAPTAMDKILPLNQYANIDKTDIDDPFGGDIEMYHSCAKEIETAIYNIAEKLQPNGYTALGCDHGGFALMQKIKSFLDKSGVAYKDFGTYDEKSTDYPIYAKKVAESILNGECTRGILICSTGIGISITANRYKGIRAALCHDVFSAKATREHNDANILCMGAKVIGDGYALEVIKAFLESEFSEEERHVNRINQIEI